MTILNKVKTYLLEIEKNRDLNCFISVFPEEAIQKAEELDNKISNQNPVGKLAGKVIAIKDVISIKDKNLTCCSDILKNFYPIYNATVIEKIIREDGIIIGKTNCDEFAMGSSNENSIFGPVLNPFDKTRVPGGSSGGSAVAVSANLCDLSLGTDTGGSIRQPAAFCGVYGLKPTYGRVSRFGLVAFASSFDSIGPFARSLDELSLISEIIFGFDPKDSTSINFDIRELTKKYKDPKELTIGIPKEYFLDELNTEIANAIKCKIEEFRKLGCKIVDISLPNTNLAIATYYILITAEASSNLSRYDGVKYGFRDNVASTIEKMYSSTRTKGFGKEVKRRIMLGTYVLSSGYYEAYYLKAQKARSLIQNDFIKVFNKVDCIIAPTTPNTPFKLNEKMDDPLEMYLSDIYTTSVNLAGLPAMNIPIGKDSNGLPIGMQLIGNHFKEDILFSTARLLDNSLK